MQPTSLWVYFNFQSNKKFFRDYFSNRLVSGAPPPLPQPPSVAPLRAVDLSLDLFQRPPTSPLSLVVPASHSFRYISLMELPYRSPPSPSLFHPSSTPLSSALAISLQIPRTFYTTYLPLSATVTFVRVQRYSLLVPSFRSPSFVPQNSPRKRRYRRQKRSPRAMIILRSTTEASGRLLYSSYYTLDRWSCRSFQADLKEYLSEKKWKTTIALIGLFY